MNKKQQMDRMYSWLDKLTFVAEVVIQENDMGSLEPFEIINLLNVRLHMEESFPAKFSQSNPKSDKVTTSLKPNLFVLRPNGNDKD